MIVQELINTFIKAHNGIAVFAGIGERIREGHELWQEAKQLGIIDKTAFIFGQMNEAPGLRLYAAASAIKHAEFFRDRQQKDVLLFMDNIFRYVQAGSELSSLFERTPSAVGYQPTLYYEVGKLQERINSTANGSITSIQAMYIPADDFTDPAAVANFAHFDATIFLSRTMAAQGLYPAVDPLRSTSKSLTPKFTSKAHIQIAKDVTNVLAKLIKLEEVVSVLGQEALSKADQQILESGRRLQLFLTQPFVVSEKFSNVKGRFVPLKATLEGAQAILNHQYNYIPLEHFKYAGDLDEIINRYETTQAQDVNATVPPVFETESESVNESEANQSITNATASEQVQLEVSHE